MWLWIPSIVVAYLVGSIPFGVLIGKARGVNIREEGSRNIGATNVGRVLGRKLGMTCFLLDVLKGAAPVLIAGKLCGVLDQPPDNLTIAQMWLWLAVASATVLGHMYSIFIGFAGGKGVATGFGAMVAMWPLLTIPALGGLVVWYAVLRLSHYVSVASMAAAVSVPVWYIACRWPTDPDVDVLGALLHAHPPFALTMLMALLVIYKHRGNIARIRRGEEPKSGGSVRRGDVMPPAEDLSD